MDESVSLSMTWIVGILLFVSIVVGGVYYYHKLEISNFQNTIKDLNDEQKCIHICGFEFDGYLESYKFCTEKCDRISEREQKCLNGG